LYEVINRRVVLQGGGDVTEVFDIYKLLNYGTGTAIAVVLVFFVIKTLSFVVNSVMTNQKEMLEKQSEMTRGMADTLKDVAGTLLVIQDNIKDLQVGQDALWSEFRKLKGGNKNDS
jgi:hypothetical protein